MGTSQFSEKGDSGAIIVDAKGRIGGTRTAGPGETGFIDVRYATPFYLYQPRLHDSYRKPHGDAGEAVLYGGILFSL